MENSRDKSVANLLAKSPHLSLTPTNRIKCDVTGHEMPVRFDTIQQYLDSKSYKKALEWYSYDYSSFLPYIIPSRKNDKQLWCTVTKQPLNKIPEEVKKHMSGKKFRRLLEEYKNTKTSKGDNDSNLDDEEMETSDNSEELEDDEEDPNSESDQDSLDDLIGEDEVEDDGEEEEKSQMVIEEERGLATKARSKRKEIIGEKRRLHGSTKVVSIPKKGKSITKELSTRSVSSVSVSPPPVTVPVAVSRKIQGNKILRKNGTKNKKNL
eukprot:gene2611-5104_t